MTICIFSGPSLPAEVGKHELDAVFLPPAAQGDLYRAALKGPVAIGLIDGYFERVPSVSHKEILWAMSRGIHVIGAASMGALRAAELSLFGMEGVGEIYQMYSSGQLEADDEVAVAHALEEEGYRPLSEALVNIRVTLEAATAAGVIPAATCGRLIELSRAMFYADRCYPLLLRRAVEEGAPAAQMDALRRFVTEGRIDQKRADAISLLRAMRERFECGAPPRQVHYHFERTDAWENIRKRAEGHEARTTGGMKESVR
ncbi:MAG: TfuA-like protein [Polyangiaceae bacterium]